MGEPVERRPVAASVLVADEWVLSEAIFLPVETAVWIKTYCSQMMEWIHHRPGF